MSPNISSAVSRSRPFWTAPSTNAWRRFWMMASFFLLMALIMVSASAMLMPPMRLTMRMICS